MIKKKMLVIFYLLLLLRDGHFTKGYNFVTKTIPVGQNVTLVCPRPPSNHSQSLFWIKIASGNWPEFLGQTITFDYEGVSKTRHFTSKQGNGTFILHIKEAQRNDTGLYYCFKVGELKLIFMKGSFLKIQGPEADDTTVTQLPLYESLHPGDLVTLQCFVFSDCERRKCPTDHRVYWFRGGSDKFRPSVVYADGKSEKECETSPEAQKCVYSYSKNVSHADAGTYYCAVATYEEIIFGNGTELDIEEQRGFGESKIFLLLCVAVAACLVVIMCLIYTLKKKPFHFCNDAGTEHGPQQNEQRNAHCLVYSAPTFTRSNGGKAERRKVKATHEETVYTQVRDFRIH
ncbi:uncharacterized protein LOC124859935 [Girardinichthys multiradiatus]|uniref:uncharacterized protein LOC124859935 n=1 Tax=Girardinichthys multiradiatus TaxID=208333 RepID=UPI001FADC38F|nr:uncharacterized protein LOC124859935 [Girardinichthys multiradiatus]